MIRNWIKVTGVAVLPVITAAFILSGEARAVETAITCINPSSGTAWEIKVDYEKGTVDSNPARISDREISWRDAKDGNNYTLNRASGDLTMVGASSTGGYFLFDRCTLKNSG